MIATPPLGILAGGGSLPARLAAAAKAEGRAVFIVKLKGQADDPALDGYPHMQARPGQAKRILAGLRGQGVRDLVLAGRVRRPSLAELRPDMRAARFMLRAGRAALGDDGLLRALTRELEDEGFRVLGAHELVTDIVTPAGVIGEIAPPVAVEADILKGVRLARAIGALDIGQAVVVQQGLVLGVEALEGTDALITRCGPLQRAGRGAVLVKTRKPQQDARLDLPTMGVATVCRAAEAGLTGIVMEAGGTLMLDREAVAREADRAGLFVLGLTIETATSGADEAPATGEAEEAGEEGKENGAEEGGENGSGGAHG